MNNKVLRWFGVITTATLLGACVGIGCSQPTHDRLVAFFFEVPDDQAPPVAGAPPEQDVLAKLPDRLTLPPSRFASVHVPVLMRNCTACHDALTKRPPEADVAAACKPCHEDYFGERVRHEPVAQGDCIACHEMHRSPFKKLLSEAVFDTCLECHDEPEDLSEDAHGVADVENCTNCHDPHFGAERLLKPDYKRFMVTAAGDDADG